MRFLAALLLLATLVCAQAKKDDQPAFFDEPSFTVAGVTDNTYRGGHGSDTVLRSAEALTQATAALGAADKLDKLDKLGDALEAVRRCQKAAESDPSEAHIFDWGAELLKHRAPDPAIEIFARGTRMYPHSTKMLLGLAASYYARGSYEEAKTRFFEAADLNPPDPTPYLMLGMVQRREITDAPGYADRMSRFVNLQPNNAMANYYAATCLLQHRTGPNDSAAQALLERAIHLNPNLALAYLQLGILHSEHGNDAKALSAFQTAVKIDPKMPEAHYPLSQIYLKMGENQSAKHELQIYDQVSREQAERLERERGQLQQFVVSLRSKPQ